VTLRGSTGRSRSWGGNDHALGSGHIDTNLGRCHFAILLLASGNTSEAAALGEAALAAHHAALGLAHPWTRDSARITADALAALGRTGEAAARPLSIG
jgi:hypothetical protein